MSANSLADKQRVTLVGAAVNILLAIGKIIAGVVGHSQALIVDGVHSISDLLSDGLVLFAASIGSKQADEDHPYGHARIETAATVGIGVLLIAVAIGFVYDASQRLLEPERLLIPGWIALVAAVASVAVKEALYHYTLHVGREVRSALIQANAWHHRSDALSSVVVIGGVIGGMAGQPWLDAVAAIVVALMVGYVGVRFAWNALRELVDTGLDVDELEELSARIDAVKEVRGHHGLRTRRMGGDVLVDVHIIVDDRVSVSEGHNIAGEVRRRLIENMPDVTDVMVYVDHGTTEMMGKEAGLPLREQVLRDLSDVWRDETSFRQAQRITLHYSDDGIEVELILPAGLETDSARALETRLQQAKDLPSYIRSVKVLVSAGPA
jgi:cation diffusion facilitator family transporter